MKKFYNNDREGARKSGKKFGSGGSSWKGAGAATRPGMHDATCGKCGVACQVPFRPTGNRPIFCSNCFKTEDGFGPKRLDDKRPGKSFGGGSDSNAKIEQALKHIEAKLDALIEALTSDEEM